MKAQVALIFSLWADKALAGIGYSFFKISSLWSLFRKGKESHPSEVVSIKIKKEFED